MERCNGVQWAGAISLVQVLHGDAIGFLHCDNFVERSWLTRTELQRDSRDGAGWKMYRLGCWTQDPLFLTNLSHDC